MSPLTPQQVLALAPDDASAKAAQGLVKPSKWITLGAFEGGLWGECQGSGAKPYQVLVDANGLGAKCSCPSRKFPCKHGLALMLMFASGTGQFASDPPAWMTEWLAGRRERAEKQAVKREAAAEAPAPDPAQTARRQEARWDRMREGGAFLGLWMRDLVRQGFSDLPARPPTFWREVAARMVDAQATGLARRVEDMQGTVGSGRDWPARLLGAMGRTQLFLDALERRELLPEASQADLRVALGWALDRDSVVDPTVDDWVVAGVVFDQEGPLHERRVWLEGLASGRTALLLDFAHGGRKFEHAFTPGTQVRATLAWFPSAAPFRAVVQQPPESASPAPAGRFTGTMQSELETVSERLAANPWILRHPFRIGPGRLARDERGWHVSDSTGTRVPLQIRDEAAWLWLAGSRALPVEVFGEWNGVSLRPLTVCIDRSWVNLADL